MLLKELILIYFLGSVICQICQENQAIFIDTCLDQCPFDNIVQLKNGVPYCFQCDRTKFLIPNTERSSCTCALQTYPSLQNQECLPCHYTCLSCFGPSSNSCLTCDQENKKTFRQFSENKCLCPAGYFDNQQIGSIVCQTCHEDCLTCTNQRDDSCITCRSGMVKNQFGNCICDKGFILNQQGECYCPSPLLVQSDETCKNAVNFCRPGQQIFMASQKNIAKFAKQNQQQCRCVDGLYRIKGICRACRQNQIYNQRKGRCQCGKDANLFEGECILCASNQYFNKRTGECNCKKNEFLTQNGQCIKCPKKAILVNGSCGCIQNYYLDKSGKCKRCTKKSDHATCVDRGQNHNAIERLTFEEIDRFSKRIKQKKI